MRYAMILLALMAIASPVFAQTGDQQDHLAHHPATDAGVPAETSAPSDTQASMSGAGAGKPASSGSMGCAMMPDMMQSMMRGMMQGMVGSGAAAMGAGMGAPIGANVQMPMADQNLPAITYRAIVQRTIASLQGPAAKDDGEFLRLAAVLELALADAARVAASFSDDAELRHKAQQLSESHADDLRAIRDALDARK